MKIIVLALMAFGFAGFPAMAAEHEAAPAEPVPHASAIVAMEVEPVTGIDRQLHALQLVQDRMVSGNIKAVDAQRALLEQMISGLETRDGLAGLSENDAALALPMALLNGADPERVRAILGQSGTSEKGPFLLGALAYAEGRVSEALVAFETVDQAQLSPIARAQFYLTKGVMLAGEEPEKAVQMFAQARLAAPGTLIEEAALRREALLEMAKPERFLTLVRSYLHRFSNSPFASAFISQFAFSVAELDASVQDRITAELDDLLAPAQVLDRQNFYSILARSSLIGGNHALTDFATQRAVRDVKNPSQLLSARLYRAAFEIAGENHLEASTELYSLMRVPLQASDREILTAAISVAQELRRWPYGEADILARSEMPVPVLPIAESPTDTSLASVTQANKLLDETKAIAGVTP
jgi:chemotaxis protein MotC